MGIFQILSRLPGGRRGIATCEPALDSTEVIARIDVLAAAGRPLEGLQFACPHAPRLDAPELWRRLQALWMEAAAELAAQAVARPDWPPTLEDPFPGAQLPEIDAEALNGDVLGGAILHHGSLIVRNLFDSATATRLRAGVDAALDACTAHLADPTAPLTRSSHVPFALPEGAPLAAARGFAHSDNAVWAAESPRLLLDILALYRARGVLAAIEDYLGEAPMLSVGKTVLRRAQPSAVGGDFHQDGAFMGADIRSVNVWVALSDCGVDAPGLERSCPAACPASPRGGRAEPTSTGRSVARRRRRPQARPAWRPPAFRCGDAVLFDQLMLHATYSTPAMGKRRYAIESWFFAPSAYPADQVAIAV